MKPHGSVVGPGVSIGQMAPMPRPYPFIASLVPHLYFWDPSMAPIYCPSIAPSPVPFSAPIIVSSAVPSTAYLTALELYFPCSHYPLCV
ncbi:hypothetical protein N7468_009632 [Penicillium chermesinum]|uniref:Uncharacterized protein n=1 Tax=Penicillium chermesinum TaxID=63820 RepID=A0A9W9TF68_9EURO|nr:uncharacterized protein N7468_009632 [Penicillium chermesinum]KAJ5220428.1 hypothetical protein N7468_009632 [Penicillium chermesinum]